MKTRNPVHVQEGENEQDNEKDQEKSRWLLTTLGTEHVLRAARIQSTPIRLSELQGAGRNRVR